MKKILILFVASVLLGSCVSVKKYNANINVLRNEAQLKSDVDYIYKKLQKLHPQLYWYLSKRELDSKFDSLKLSINAPMTPNDFFLKLSPVLASIGQGHLQLYPLYKKWNKKERKSLRHSGPSPLNQFDFEVFDSNLYIVGNRSNDQSIKPGTEVLAINNIKPRELITKYRPSISTDGYNKTFINRKLSRYFSIYYFLENGKTDSVLYELRYNDSIRFVSINRKINTKTDSTQKDKSDSVFRAKLKEEDKRRYLGYDKFTGTYSKNITFLDSGSSIAVMKINDFYRGNAKAFFKKSFKQLDTLNTKSLILDLRDNYGGRLNEVYELYSYLADSDFYFTGQAEIASRTSLLHDNYFRARPIYEKAILVVFIPFRLITMGVIFFKVYRGADHKYYITYAESKAGHPKSTHFKGKVYVMVNGGSFSATTLLSANLKGSKRSVFVGDETGGAYNGFVAGAIPLYILPETKLSLSFGLAFIQPYYKSDVVGRGIFPDIEIIPTVSDRILKYDPELEWILDDIRCRESMDEKH